MTGDMPAGTGWRVGDGGRTIYHDNVFMGIMETAELAELVVTMLQEAGSDRSPDSLGARIVRPREFHRRGPGAVGGIYDECVCGAQWLRYADRCVTQPSGAGS